jgi:hypothetical protein
MNPSTTSGSPYDDIDLGSEPFKPEAPGETLEIELQEVREIETKEGKKGVVLAGIDDDGAKRDWVAWNLHNKAEIRREKPLIGEQVKIAYDGRDPNATNEAFAARLFTISVPSREFGY